MIRNLVAVLIVVGLAAAVNAQTCLMDGQGTYTATNAQGSMRIHIADVITGGSVTSSTAMISFTSGALSGSRSYVGTGVADTVGDEALVFTSNTRTIARADVTRPSNNAAGKLVDTYRNLTVMFIGPRVCH